MKAEINEEPTPDRVTSTPAAKSPDAAPGTPHISYSENRSSAGRLGPVRLFNASCWAIAGIAMLLSSTVAGSSRIPVLIIGIVCVSYAVKIVLTRTSYFVHPFIYVFTIVAVLLAWTKLTH